VSFTFILFSFAMAFLLLWSHRKNIERLKAGTESKIYIWYKPESSDSDKASQESGSSDSKTE
jgi:glycerol-3-phosphate acyltransferase PlsY